VAQFVSCLPPLSTIHRLHHPKKIAPLEQFVAIRKWAKAQAIPDAALASECGKATLLRFS